MNDDLISRQAATDTIWELSDMVFKNIEKGATYPPIEWFTGMADADSIIKDLPSIDAVPVVRCRDCKWCEHFETDGIFPNWFCKNWYGGTDSDGYCHEAERKEE